MTTRPDDLRSIHMLAELSTDHQQKLMAIGQVVEIRAGSTIFREGDAGTDVYFIIAGRVGLDVCAPGVGCRRILTVGEGELLGWAPLLAPQRLTATARALSDVQAWVLSASAILALCDSDPRFGYEFMRRAAQAIAQRLSATRLQLLNVYGEPLPSPAARD